MHKNTFKKLQDTIQNFSKKHVFDWFIVAAVYIGLNETIKNNSIIIYSSKTNNMVSNPPYNYGDWCLDRVVLMSLSYHGEIILWRGRSSKIRQMRLIQKL